MSIGIEVKGIASAQTALRKALKDVNTQSELMVSVIMQAIAANTMPYVPVDTSFLINSEYRRSGVSRNGAWGVIGFGAAYAPYVHEGPQKNWQKPGASNNFLGLGVRDTLRDDLSGIIARFQPK